MPYYLPVEALLGREETQMSNTERAVYMEQIELRNFFVDNFKSQDKPFRHSGEVTVNVETLKINIDFKYYD